MNAPIYEAVDNTLNTLADALTAVCGRAPHSVWLYGSAVLGDFRPGWSDIDFVAFTAEPLTEANAERLRCLRQELTARYPQRPGAAYYRWLEGVIVDRSEYLGGRFSRVVYWGTSGERITTRCELDPFARFELARYGRCIVGDADRSCFAEPGREELVAAIRRHCETVRQYAVETNERLYSCGWLLDLARCVYTLRYGDVVGKTQAGRWALGHNIFPDPEALAKTLTVRARPTEYKDLPETKAWLRSLGPTVQRYADVLEQELAGLQA